MRATDAVALKQRQRKAIFGWCLYDWANSAFTTLVVTFVYATYFSQAIAPDPLTGTTLWSRAVGVSAIVIALVSPVLGAVADQSARRLPYLMVTTGLCIAATTGLTFVAPGGTHAVVFALVLFVVANVAFETGMVFYNAFLPDIAPPERIGRISGYGWGLGYVGGLCCLVLALLVLVREEPLLGVSTAAGFNYRATNLLVAAWFIVFSVPMFTFVRDTPLSKPAPGLRNALGELANTVRELRKFREVWVFLAARILYNDGLVTIFAFGGIYAAGTFGMSLAEVIQFGITLNVAAGLGALVFGFLDDRLGGKKIILITLVALSAFTLVAVFAQTQFWFWIGGIGIGLFVGPNQSASRSLMGRFVPKARQTEFFGFFAFSGKITSFAGPLLLGAATQWFGDQRAGVATVFLFFALGGAVLLLVDEKRGVAAATGQH